MKVIKKVLILISCIFIFYGFNIVVEAAEVSITTSKDTVKPGESFTVTVSVKNGAGYVSASVSNGSGGLGSTWIEEGSKSFTCKAGNSGNITINTSGTVADFTTEKDESASRSKVVKIQEQTTTSKKTTVKTTSTTTKTDKTNNEENKEKEKQEEQEEKYLLKNLEIEDETISPEFNSENFEYTINIEDKEQLNIKAEANKDELIVEILGNEKLQYGENVITINLKGQDDKEITSYKINVLKEKSDFTLASEKNQKLEKINKIFIIIIFILIIMIITIVIIYNVRIKKYKAKINSINVRAE